MSYGGVSRPVVLEPVSYTHLAVYKRQAYKRFLVENEKAKNNILLSRKMLLFDKKLKTKRN